MILAIKKDKSLCVCVVVYYYIIMMMIISPNSFWNQTRNLTSFFHVQTIGNKALSWWLVATRNAFWSLGDKKTCIQRETVIHLQAHSLYLKLLEPEMLWNSEFVNIGKAKWADSRNLLPSLGQHP